MLTSDSSGNVLSLLSILLSILFINCPVSIHSFFQSVFASIDLWSETSRQTNCEYQAIKLSKGVHGKLLRRHSPEGRSWKSIILLLLIIKQKLNEQNKVSMFEDNCFEVSFMKLVQLVHFKACVDHEIQFQWLFKGGHPIYAETHSIYIDDTQNLSISNDFHFSTSLLIILLLWVVCVTHLHPPRKTGDEKRFVIVLWAVKSCIKA